MGQTTLAKHVSAQLRAVLAHREIGNHKFAEMLGENEMWVWRRVRNRTPITFDDLERIAAALGLPTSYFTERDALNGSRHDDD